MAPDTCSITVAIGGGTGLHVVFVDGATIADAGDYTLNLVFP